MKIAILSDLHFTGDAGKFADTHAIVGATNTRSLSPLVDLEHLVDDEKLAADVLICPGDITLRANGAGLSAAWSYLQRVKNKLSCTAMFVTTGNHDISSRDPSLKDPKAVEQDEHPDVWERLKTLRPCYPSEELNELQVAEYWGYHLCVTKVGWVRFFIVNSCNSHARGKTEYEKGRVTDFMLQRIKDKISEEACLLNILVCHHHPMKIPEVAQKDADYSEMEMGARLMEVLEKSDQNFLVIHGHKHRAKMQFAQSTSSKAPVIFSAGSFSAALSPGYFSGSANQFYILEFDEIIIKKMGLVVRTFAWDWIRSNGFQKATVEPSRPERILYGGGFGLRVNIDDLSQRISGCFGQPDRLRWSSAVGHIPELNYLSESDLTRLTKRLKADYSIDVRHSDSTMYPHELLRN